MDETWLDTARMRRGFQAFGESESDIWPETGGSGKRMGPRSPEECLRIAEAMIAEAERLARREPRKSFVAKFRAHEDYEQWKREQNDPRYW
jgi:hypothetical protein